MLMTRKRIGSGSTFEERSATRARVVAGDWVFVSGTSGFDYTTMSISEDVVEPTGQCFRNIESALAQAVASLKDVVRVTSILPDGAVFERCSPVLRKYFGEVRPAATMISAGHAGPRMKIQIEVSALKRACAGAV
jgi:enamine deaminase RidA (YjgF/YER057c/UK114 family)